MEMVVSGSGEFEVGKRQRGGDFKFFEDFFVNAADFGSGVVKHVDIYF